MANIRLLLRVWDKVSPIFGFGNSDSKRDPNTKQTLISIALGQPETCHVKPIVAAVSLDTCNYIIG